MLLLRSKKDKQDMLDCSPYDPIKKSLPLLRFSWSRCQYEDQNSANQLVFPCSSRENLTFAEQQESMSQINDKWLY